eukprot:2632270-Ditylum_brightwellii.AAC.1
MALINWDAFWITRKHQSQQSKQIVKMPHGILPTNKLLYRHKSLLRQMSVLSEYRRDTGPHYIMPSYRTTEMEMWSTV